jgi:hypothetical protein
LLDIIYISNGEPEAERWYTHLAQTCKRTVKRVIDGDGRSAADKAAAQQLAMFNTINTQQSNDQTSDHWATLT